MVAICTDVAHVGLVQVPATSNTSTWVVTALLTKSPDVTHKSVPILVATIRAYRALAIRLPLIVTPAPAAIDSTPAPSCTIESCVPMGYGCVELGGIVATTAAAFVNVFSRSPSCMTNV
jgi:hypothetical protein